MSLITQNFAFPISKSALKRNSLLQYALGIIFTFGHFQRHGHYISDNCFAFRSLLHIFAKCKPKIIHNHYKAVILDKAPYEFDATFLNRLSDIVYNDCLRGHYIFRTLLFTW